MHDNHGNLDEGNQLHEIMTKCPEPKKVIVSPLGWSIIGRLMWAALASVLLWLSVAWAIGWLR